MIDKLEPDNVTGYTCNYTKINELIDAVNELTKPTQPDPKPTQEKWKPMHGEKYWHIEPSGESIAKWYKWFGDSFDTRFYSRGLVFRTEQEAEAAAETMLAAIKEKE